MIILIVGGTGFFGKSILDSFIRNKLTIYGVKEIIVLSRSADKFKNKNLQFLDERISYLEGDITKTDNLPPADIVIHAATSTKQKDYKNNAESEKQNIELGASNYFKLAQKFHKNSKIVYCSSGAVYGQQPSNIEKIKEDFPFQDVTSLSPEKRDYALGKRYAEEQFKKLGSLGFNVSIARCFAFYGKYLPTNGHFACGNFLAAAKKGKDIIVKADHQVYRSYMHADDLVDNLLKIALNSSPNCPIYNLGSDKEISVFDLAEKIANRYNVKVIKTKKIDFNRVDRYVPNIDYLKKLI